MLKIKIVIRAVLVTVGTALFLNGALLSTVSNMHTGIVLTCVLGLVLLLWGVFYDKIKEATSKGLLKALKCMVVGAICFETLLVGYVALCGETDTATCKEDALIVLGAGVRGDRVTLPLKLRLDRALEYHEKNPSALIIVSGGQGVGETVTEAYAMKKYLVEKGVPEELIIEEDKATSTSENMKYSKRILDGIYGGDVSICFVTNNFHVYRSSRLAKMAGFENVTHLHTGLQWYNYVPNYIRETLAILKMWIFRY